MKKILVINGHPDPEHSTACKAVLEAFLKRRPDAVVRTIANCGAEGFDVPAEQAALKEADIIVWHFPFYWYSVPALMKKWIDDVLTHGFAYGSSGTALHGKRLLLSFTTGASASEYATGRAMNWPVEAFLPPLLQTANLCGMKTLEPVWSNGMMYIPGVSTPADLERVKAAALEHAEKLVDRIAADEANETTETSKAEA